jgi:hypothetical protein
MQTTPIVALIYDFDKTLSPKDMQEYGFLPGLGIDPGAFWADCRAFALENLTDGVLAYMYMMRAAADRAGTPLTRDALEALGRSVEFYPGVEGWFDRVNRIGEAAGVHVEHYIISSGLKEIIDGSRIAGAFKAVFAASYVYDGKGRAIWPATDVNYTAKTQYLFRINKGILDVTNDYDLNAHTPEYLRRVPFANMIYVGDGLTDVPCMKMTKLKGGCSIVVYAPGGGALADEMLLQRRADFALPADYSEDGEMEKTVALIMRKMRARHDLDMVYEAQTRAAKERM